MSKGSSDSAFSARLIAWQVRYGRHSLPWQGTRDTYRVWLAEIMLQQTQVATVLDYYPRFVQRFPDVKSLASAALDEVLAQWSGLGYYGRARNLHRCARTVVQQHHGRFPDSAAELMQLPGIGRSTAAAIAAFGFGERVAILDGNVKRVLTRVLAFEGDLSEAKHERELWTHATRLLPERDIERYTQGLMDLGATVCKARAPSCPLCPVRAQCAALRARTQEHYPVRTRRLKRGTREHVWLWLRWRDQVWLVQRPAKGVWGGLWSLPEFDSAAVFAAATAHWPGTREALPSFKHALTHFDWRLHPVRWTLPARTSAAHGRAVASALPQGRWFSLVEALDLGLPAPLRKLLTSSGAGIRLPASAVLPQTP